MKTYALQAFLQDDLAFTIKLKCQSVYEAQQRFSDLMKSFPQYELIIKDQFLIVATRNLDAEWHTFR